MLKIPRILRHHPLFFICAPLLVIALTWPTLFYVFNTDIFWLPSYDFDVWMKFWDAWYGGLILRGEADFYFTDLLFYPEGLSLVYHNFNIPHILVFGSLQRFMPGSAAYNLSHLLIVFANISAAYLYLYYLLRDKPSSLLGALIFGLNPFVLNHSHHPDLNLIASLPLSLYFLERGLGERRWKWILSAGFCAGFTVFIGMYIFVCLLFSLALRLLSLVRKDWRERDFWLRLLVLAALIGAIGLVRVYPIVQDSNALEEALGKNDGEERFRDLLAYVVCPGHPLSEQLFARVFDQPVPDVDKYGFLGYLPLLLIVFGATRASFRRRLWPWLLVALPFMVLRLGSVLTIGGWTYDSILLPKYYLDTLFPAIFGSFLGDIAFSDWHPAAFSLLSQSGNAAAARRAVNAVALGCRRAGSGLAGLRVLSAATGPRISSRVFGLQHLAGAGSRAGRDTTHQLAAAAQSLEALWFLSGY